VGVGLDQGPAGQGAQVLVARQCVPRTPPPRTPPIDAPPPSSPPIPPDYTNSLISIASFVYNTFKVCDTVHALPTTPLEEMVRLRGQCESEAKQQKLFARVDPNFLEWEEAQAARVKAEKEYRAASGQKKTQLLRDWAILSLHTIMPRTQCPPLCPSSLRRAPPFPSATADRVGIIRKLRLNVSLKRAGDGFVLDCTSQRSHKTSRLSAQTARSALPPPRSAHFAHWSVSVRQLRPLRHHALASAQRGDWSLPRSTHIRRGGGRYALPLPSAARHAALRRLVPVVCHGLEHVQEARGQGREPQVAQVLLCTCGGDRTLVALH
jgi:hypothetical protein